MHSLYRGHTRWAAALARQHGKRYWAVPHGCLDPWSLRQRGLVKRLWLAAGGRRYLAGAERVIFSTQRGVEKAARWVRPERALAVHWPVELPAEADGGRARAAFRERHGIAGDAPVLLFVGRLHSVKRPIHAVEAFCRAVGSGAELVVVGMDDDLTAADVIRAVPEELRRNVHLVGGLAGAGLAEAYRAADGFLSLSFQENFGYAAVSAHHTHRLRGAIFGIGGPGHRFAAARRLARLVILASARASRSSTL